MEAARALGYRPNAIARSLITRRSNLVGLILPASAALYYPEITTEITAATAKRGARVLLMTVDATADVGSAIEQLGSYQVDGVIAAAPLTVEQLEGFELHRTPVIFYNRPPPHHAGNAVVVDHADGEGRLVERLCAAGHRRFGLITGPSDSTVAKERADGAIMRLNKLGGSLVAVAEGDYRYESGVEAFTSLWDARDDGLDAIICANDAMALGAMDSARLKHGLKIPEDISVVEMLFDRIENPDLHPERRVFAGEIVPGRSARLGRETA